MQALERAAAIIRGQIPHRKKMWLRAVDQNIGNDVVDFVKDIERHESARRNRDTTWGEGKGKVERRRVRNTMGYTCTNV